MTARLRHRLQVTAVPGMHPGRCRSATTTRSSSLRSRQPGTDARPHRFRHHFSHTRADRAGAKERPDRAERLVFRRHSARARRIKAGQLQRSSPPPAPARCTRPARTMLPGKKPDQRPMSLWQAKPPVPGQ